MSKPLSNPALEPSSPPGESAPPLLLGFEFFGSENIGDDLMLAGFLTALDRLGYRSRYSLFGTSSFFIESQRLRFPEISWINRGEVPRDHLLGSQNFLGWVGVGDTPFQYTVGPWALNFLSAELAALDDSVPCLMTNIGAESEIREVADRYAAVAQRFQRISTRDEHSTRIMVDMLGVSPDRVQTSADLAHIALEELFRERPKRRRQRFGIVVAADTMTTQDVEQIKGYLLRRRGGRAAFIAADSSTRRFCERDTFHYMGSRPWSRIRFRARLSRPDYHGGTLTDLVTPIADCETLISSRYHALLTGAWAGCKVAAINRSSKVQELSRQLGIPFATLPVSRDDLYRLEREAAVVPRERLLPYCEMALEGVSFAFEGLRNRGD